MLTAKIEATGKKCAAYKVVKSDGPFVCRGCGGQLTLKKGPKKIDHFSHKAADNCSLADKKDRNDSRHREIVTSIRDALLESGGRYACRVEKQIGQHWTDIAIHDRVRDLKIAVEVQRSPIPLAEIESRMRAYTEAGYFTLWIIAADLNCGARLPLMVDSVIQRTPEWIRNIHRLHYGTIFYYYSRLEFQPVRLEAATSYVELREWGDGESAGGYERYLKASRTYNLGDDISLEDLEPVRNKLAEHNPQVMVVPKRLRWWTEVKRTHSNFFRRDRTSRHTPSYDENDLDEYCSRA